jgi:hypothetical protein
MNIGLASTSTSIARDTKKDSSVMKSIGILTMVFLPATFTAVSHPEQSSSCRAALTIISKTLFTTPAMEAMEPSHALYWSVTIPVTIGTVLLWITGSWLAKVFRRREKQGESI